MSCNGGLANSCLPFDRETFCPRLGESLIHSPNCSCSLHLNLLSSYLSWLSTSPSQVLGHLPQPFVAPLFSFSFPLLCSDSLTHPLLTLVMLFSISFPSPALFNFSPFVSILPFNPLLLPFNASGLCWVYLLPIGFSNYF